MRVTNIRRGRIFRIFICILIAIPVVYLLATWSDGHKKVREVYQSKFAARSAREAPRLVEGEYWC